MIKNTLTNLKKVCTFAFLPRIWRGHIVKCTPKKFQRSPHHLRVAEKSTKASNTNQANVEKFKRIANNTIGKGELHAQDVKFYAPINEISKPWEATVLNHEYTLCQRIEQHEGTPTVQTTRDVDLGAFILQADATRAPTGEDISDFDPPILEDTTELIDPATWHDAADSSVTPPLAKTDELDLPPISDPKTWAAPKFASTTIDNLNLTGTMNIDTPMQGIKVDNPEARDTSEIDPPIMEETTELGIDTSALHDSIEPGVPRPHDAIDAYAPAPLATLDTEYLPTWYQAMETGVMQSSMQAYAPPVLATADPGPIKELCTEELVPPPKLALSVSDTTEIDPPILQDITEHNEKTSLLESAIARATELKQNINNNEITSVAEAAETIEGKLPFTKPEPLYKKPEYNYLFKWRPSIEKSSVQQSTVNCALLDDSKAERLVKTIIYLSSECRRHKNYMFKSKIHSRNPRSSEIEGKRLLRHIAKYEPAAEPIIRMDLANIHTQESMFYTTDKPHSGSRELGTELTDTSPTLKKDQSDITKDTSEEAMEEDEIYGSLFGDGQGFDSSNLNITQTLPATKLIDLKTMLCMGSELNNNVKSDKPLSTLKPNINRDLLSDKPKTTEDDGSISEFGIVGGENPKSLSTDEDPLVHPSDSQQASQVVTPTIFEKALNDTVVDTQFKRMIQAFEEIRFLRENLDNAIVPYLNCLGIPFGRELVQVTPLYDISIPSKSQSPTCDSNKENYNINISTGLNQDNNAGDRAKVQSNWQPKTELLDTVSRDSGNLQGIFTTYSKESSDVIPQESVKSIPQAIEKMENDYAKAINPTEKTAILKSTAKKIAEILKNLTKTDSNPRSFGRMANFMSEKISSSLFLKTVRLRQSMESYKLFLESVQADALQTKESVTSTQSTDMLEMKKKCKKPKKNPCKKKSPCKKKNPCKKRKPKCKPKCPVKCPKKKNPCAPKKKKNPCAPKKKKNPCAPKKKKCGPSKGKPKCPKPCKFEKTDLDFPFNFQDLVPNPYFLYSRPQVVFASHNDGIYKEYQECTNDLLNTVRAREGAEGVIGRRFYPLSSIFNWPVDSPPQIIY